MKPKSDAKCKFCGEEEVHHNGLCLFCYKCVPLSIINEPGRHRPTGEWIRLVRSVVQWAHAKHMLAEESE